MFYYSDTEPNSTTIKQMEDSVIDPHLRTGVKFLNFNILGLKKHTTYGIKTSYSEGRNVGPQILVVCDKKVDKLEHV